MRNFREWLGFESRDELGLTKVERLKLEESEQRYTDLIENMSGGLGGPEASYADAREGSDADLLSKYLKERKEIRIKLGKEKTEEVTQTSVPQEISEPEKDNEKKAA